MIKYFTEKVQKRWMVRYTMLILTGVFLTFTSTAQEKVQLNMNSNTSLSFDGTSNVHDWECKVTEIKGQGAFLQSLFNGNEIPETPVKNVQVTIPVKSIKSGKGGMDKVMYDALKIEEHPEIKYELISSEVIQKTENEFTLQTQGYLTVAGVTKEIGLQVNGKKMDDNSIEFTGSQNLKMTEFNVDPPKALFGAIKSGNGVDVQFKAVFSK